MSKIDLLLSKSSDIRNLCFGFAIMLYVVGFIASNYLYSFFGIYEPNILNPKYLVTGALSACFIIIPAALSFLILKSIDPEKAPGDVTVYVVARFFYKSLIFSLITSYLLISLYGTITQNNISIDFNDVIEELTRHNPLIPILSISALITVFFIPYFERFIKSRKFFDIYYTLPYFAGIMLVGNAYYKISSTIRFSFDLIVQNYAGSELFILLFSWIFLITSVVSFLYIVFPKIIYKLTVLKYTNTDSVWLMIVYFTTIFVIVIKALTFNFLIKAPQTIGGFESSNVELNIAGKFFNGRILHQNEEVIYFINDSQSEYVNVYKISDIDQIIIDYKKE